MSQKCNIDMELTDFQVPSGKDKEEKASFIYTCKECGIEFVKEFNLGDKGGM